MSGIPTHVGRFEVLGLLATGGMAEVFLARLSGPSGFQKPVVLKRVLPHLARQPDFRKMFLHEARISSTIHHNNVVLVQELCETEDDLYLVMEYLQGESVATTNRSLKKLGESMPMLLGAHIVAEACAGLHAAHELTSEDGTSLGVIHRDVSPHNVFLTYDGHVKVIDFGIAKAKSTDALTKTGELKGKAVYMAPEQFKGAAIDRRVDVFALGVMLFELTTGKRLFERDNEVLSMHAVCAEPIPSPSSVASEPYPPALEAIVQKALARDPAERYPTAAAMRKDLVAALRSLTSNDAEEDLSTLLKRVFVERIGDKKRLLANLQLGNAIERIPLGEDSVRSMRHVKPAGLGIEPDPPNTSSTAFPLVGLPAPPPRPRKTILVVAGALAVAAGITGAVLATRGARDASSPASSNEPVQPEPAQSQPARAEVPSATASTAGPASASASASLTPSASASPHAPAARPAYKPSTPTTVVKPPPTPTGRTYERF